MRCPGCYGSAEYAVLSGDYSTVRQPRVEEVSGGEGGAHFVEFYQKFIFKLNVVNFNM